MNYTGDLMTYPSQPKPFTLTGKTVTVRGAKTDKVRSSLTTRASAKKQKDSLVPSAGQRIVLDRGLVVQENDDSGNPKTPMTKIRYFADTNEWRQVPREHAGMFVFFDNEPFAFHASFVITSIIPSKTACYAEFQ